MAQKPRSASTSKKPKTASQPTAEHGKGVGGQVEVSTVIARTALDGLDKGTGVVDTFAALGQISVFSKLGAVFGQNVFGPFTISSVVSGAAIGIAAVDLVDYTRQYWRGEHKDGAGITSRILALAVYAGAFVAALALENNPITAVITSIAALGLAVPSYFLQKRTYEAEKHEIATKTLQQQENIATLKDGLTELHTAINDLFIRFTHLQDAYNKATTPLLQDSIEWRMRSTIEALKAHQNDMQVLHTKLAHCEQELENLGQKAKTLQEKGPLKFALLTTIPSLFTLGAGAFGLAALASGPAAAVLGPIAAVLFTVAAVSKLGGFLFEKWPAIKNWFNRSKHSAEHKTTEIPDSINYNKLLKDTELQINVARQYLLGLIGPNKQNQTITADKPAEPTSVAIPSTEVKQRATQAVTHSHTTDTQPAAAIIIEHNGEHTAIDGDADIKRRHMPG